MSLEVQGPKSKVQSQTTGVLPAGEMRIIAGPNSQPIPNQLSEQPDFSVPAELVREIDELITHYPKKRSASLMLMHAIQEHFGYISRQAVEWIASKLELQPINIYELVTFYPMFHQKPVGMYHFRVCRTLSCALGGSYKLHSYLCKKLGLDPQAPGAQTTEDGEHTVEFVECLASCGTAPVMMCNDQFYEAVSEKLADEILGEIRAEIETGE
jgi:NADH-quinone oxidoreductase subunit E